MPLTTSKEMFAKAYDGGYAVGAFNVNNMEIIQGITEGAKELNAPLILQVSAGARKYAKHVYLLKLIEGALLDAQDSGVDLPICRAVHRILYCGADPMAELRTLLDRDLTREFGES